MKGVEIGYQQFFDFPPRPLKHLSFQSNYTFIDAKTPPPANVVAIYQDKGVEARLAYNWRSSYLTYRDYVTGNLDTKSKARSYVDDDGQRYDRFSFVNDRRIVAGLLFRI